MNTKQAERKRRERKVNTPKGPVSTKTNAGEHLLDLRGVMIGKVVDDGIDEYILQEKKQGRTVKRGEAGAELIFKGLLHEGIIKQ